MLKVLERSALKATKAEVVMNCTTIIFDDGDGDWVWVRVVKVRFIGNRQWNAK